MLYKLSSQGQCNDLKAGKTPSVALATNAVADTVADAGKIPAVALVVSSAADPLADATAIPAVALAIPSVAVGGDAGNLSVMALALTSVVEGGAIPAVAPAIPMAAVGGDVGKIPAMASVMASAVDTGAIPVVASAIPTATVGGYAGKIPTVLLTTYAVADALAIPTAAVVGDVGSESIATEDDTINGMLPNMMWEDDSMVGDGGDVDDDACSTDSFSGFSDPGGQFAIRTRVFTITIGQVPTCFLMDIAATVVLSKLYNAMIWSESLSTMCFFN